MTALWMSGKQQENVIYVEKYLIFSLSFYINFLRK